MASGEGFGIAARQQHGDARVFFADCLRQRHAIEISGQHDIGEDEVDRRSGGEKVERRFRIIDSDSAVIELFE